MTKRERKVALFESKKIDYKQFIFEGHSYGSCEGFPSEESTYCTVRYGELSNYYKGTNSINGWIKVHEYYMSGSPEYPSYYSALYIKKSDLIRVKKEIEEINNLTD